jgi:hypothetical protein
MSFSGIVKSKLGIACALITSAACLAPLTANANGGDFFEELALHGLRENPNMGSPYFGFVRDERGRGINDAKLIATVKSTGETKSVETNILGHYKLDGFDNTISSNQVELRCEKEGYSQIRIERRVMEDRTLKPVEANCFLSTSVANTS